LTELSSEQITQIAIAVAKALPPAPKHSRPNNWIAIAALFITGAGLLSGGVGVWIASSNKSTAIEIRVTALESTVVKNQTRLDALESSKTGTQSSATQLTDLKESFDQFRIQYRDDIRDLKQQVVDLQSRRSKQ
jgi:chromosome segregation ATPase